MRRYLTIYTALMLLIWANCSRESPTVVPDPASQSFTGSVTGSEFPQLTGSYPESLDTDIPIDVKIVLVFSKPIDKAEIELNVTISGVTFNALGANGTNIDRTIIITPTALLSNSTLYTITVPTGILDTDGFSLQSGTSWDFTTASSTATVEAPRVIAATRYPTAGAMGVSVSTNYVEVTFTRDM
ncbi:MAG TPA: Ig-like domain-containing protein, partial [Spirochaetota bacterium]|nr:Ig-like domain-containing protein [Spirochaetota bacterium]